MSEVALSGELHPGELALAMSGRSPAPAEAPARIGRIVHYVTALSDVDNDLRLSGKHLAAMITGVYEESETLVDLQIFPNGPGIGWKARVEQGLEHGTWHWPERD